MKEFNEEEIKKLSIADLKALEDITYEILESREYVNWEIMGQLNTKLQEELSNRISNLIKEEKQISFLD